MRISKIIGAFVLFSFLTISCFSQNRSLSSYNNVIVPKQFAFQAGQNQYQLNELLEFLFNKHGFNAYLEGENPNTDRCNDLIVMVDAEPGFIWTKATIKLLDCNGFVIYKTSEGRSKIKSFDKAYTEAIRAAFNDIKKLNIQNNSVGLTQEDISPENLDSKNEPEPNPLNLPSTKYTNFSLNSNSFLLKKSSQGYNMYQESSNAEDDLSFVGKLFVVEKVLFYENVNEERMFARFDSQGNLFIGEGKSAIQYTKN